MTTLYLLIPIIGLVLGVALLTIIVFIDRHRKSQRSLAIKTAALGLVTIILFILIAAETVMTPTPTQVVFALSEFILVLLLSALFIVELRHQHEQCIATSDIADTLRSTNQKLSELDRAKTEFISLATHQIRSPLAAIKGYASLILEGEFGEIPDEPKKPIQIIFRSSNNLVTIVNEFLDISRIESGSMNYDMQNIPLNDIVADLCPTIKQLAGAKNLNFTCPIPQKRYLVRADANKLKQAFGNILDNAVKYTPKGFVRVSLKQKDDRVMVTVSDSGIGLNETDIPLLFNKFSRAKDANSVDVTGTGLGLYIAKEIIDAHSGTLDVYSAGKGQGSTWTVSLPIVGE